ncbi:MAG: hypothetical protein QM278_10420 [Pseudomonadota bacterium]|nr:hypothetical protein [Pseudomonadota bacterium]
MTAETGEEMTGIVHEPTMELAHRIRNPLGSIELFASLMLKDCRHDADQRRLEQILGAVKTINRYLSEFMVSKRNLRLSLEEFDVHELLREIVGREEILGDESEVYLEVAYADAAPLIAGNREMLKRLFVNLILYTLQSMPRGCALRIETRIMAPDPARDLPEGPGGSLGIRFAGTDWMKSGTADQAAPFDIFMTSSRKNVGLGFAILQNMMDLHGGFFTLGAEGGGAMNLDLFFPLQSLGTRSGLTRPVKERGVG